MYDGTDRTQQVNAIQQLANDIFSVFPTDMTASDVTADTMQDSGCLPENWELPSWWENHDTALLVEMIHRLF